MNTAASIITSRIQYSDATPPPEPGIFEIGLVMAGAVSAGAYTAGVVDFLVEALDAWEAAKARCASNDPNPMRWPIPGHQVKLRVISGASAGAMTAVITSVALRYTFPHVRDRASGDASPLYRPWVKDIDILKLLMTTDLAVPAAPVVSMLDSSALISILESALNFKGLVAPPRPYLEPQVRVILTEGNLRGIPYFLKMRGNTLDGLGMVAHSDYQSFCVPYGRPTVNNARPDDIVLNSENLSTDPSWHRFGLAALASGAFPIGLAPRVIERDGSDFNYRFVLIPGDGTEPAEIATLQPQWGAAGTAPNPYRTVAVDGGTMDNEPLELARVELAGLLGRNTRDGALANRATILIDPFPDLAGAVDDPTRGQQEDLLHAGVALMGAWKDQARFNPADLALAGDENSYSRFLVSPDRGISPESNNFALACGALGGFSGFLSEAFRHHDYMLGRRNCQKFLQEHFCLPVENVPVFGVINPILKQHGSRWIAPGPGPLSLPLIPLMTADLTRGIDVTTPEARPIWPNGAFDPESLRAPAGARLGAIADHLLRNSVHLNWFFQWLAKIGLARVRGAALDKVIAMVKQQLVARALL